MAEIARNADVSTATLYDILGLRMSCLANRLHLHGPVS